MKPYQQSVKQVLQYFETDREAGLSKEEAKKRLERDGKNILPETKRESWIVVFLRQFKDPLIYLLLIAAIIIFFVGQDQRDSFIISVVILFNAIIGTIQEGRARNILDELKKFVKTTSVVRRDGKKEIVDDSLLVVGDLILLQEGQQVPADARLVEVNELRIDEAALTGESVGVHKKTEALSDDVAVADRKNMIFRGTYVLSGTATAIVTNIGLDTEIGRIHTSIEEINIVMPLKRELKRLSYWILAFIAVTCSALFVLGVLTGKPIDQLLVSLSALFICVIPEGLPIALTVILVTGVYRMARHNVLARNLHAVEGLGRTDVIVIDKTGTLTHNEMMVARAYSDGTVWEATGEGYYEEGTIKPLDQNQPDDYSEKLLLVGKASILLNSTEINFDSESKKFSIKGDPTEAAMFVFAKKLEFEEDRLKKEYTLLHEIPFDSELRYHAGFYKKDDKIILFVNGAPEALLDLCDHVEDDAQDQLKQFLDEGLRMVACAMRTFDAARVEDEIRNAQETEALHDTYIKELQFLGLLGIQDAIRKEVPETVKKAKEAGLRIIMATGDHKKTALYVAKKVGIFQEDDEVMLGKELDNLSDDDVLKRLDKISVFARVSPEHKQRIVKLLHKKDLIVAMTGDGVNDAPPLVAADLGIAMGQIGTEVAKQAADLVLLDDSFVSIVKGIEQGRHIFHTLKRVVLYFFSTNFGEILIIFFAIITGLPLPLTAAQILWLNLITDGFLDMAIATEPQQRDTLKREFSQATHLVDKMLFFKMVYMAIPMGAISLWLFWKYYQIDIVKARTIALTSMAMFQWFNAWNCRSMKKSIFQLGIFTNKWLIAATLLVALLQVALLYVPFLKDLFRLEPLTAGEWGMIALFSSSILVIDEIRKLIVRRWYS